jgi:hypothetical protein
MKVVPTSSLKCIIPNELQLGVALFGLTLPVVRTYTRHMHPGNSEGRFDPGRRVSPDFQGSFMVIAPASPQPGRAGDPCDCNQKFT